MNKNKAFSYLNSEEETLIRVRDSCHSIIPNSFDEHDHLESLAKEEFYNVFLSNLSYLSPSDSRSGGLLHKTVPATLQGIEAASMLNEVRERIVTSTAQRINPFGLIIMLATIATKIIVENLARPAFKDIRPFSS